MSVTEHPAGPGPGPSPNPGSAASGAVLTEPVVRGVAGPGPRPRARFLREVAGFAAAGLLAYAADLGLFLWLRGPAGLDPLTAKALSFLAGCSVAYAGNALGTYRHAARGPRQYAVFFAVNIAGALVQLLCIAVSHYGLGFTSRRADTVSGAGIGMAIATVLRFWGTRTLVFRGEGRVGSWTG
ncbi:GtrA family protein [Streptomyces sp. NPDC060187]|uniref:GtrA family protein n=1 Tax=Streptomyces sp. NPDC060187 TaxID=3347067 RepID=UPI003668A278